MQESANARTTIVAHLDHAGRAARDATANPDLATAVHEARKAARRVRAIADLLREVVPRRDRKNARSALRATRRALGDARDHHVAQRALRELPLDDAARDAAAALTEAAADHAPAPVVVRHAVEHCAQAVTEQVAILREALPETIEWEALLDGARAVYRSARRARKAAKDSRTAFHAWRRRSKELAYQLEVLEAAPLGHLRNALDELAVAQRDVVDLIMLRAFVRMHRDLVDREAAKHLARSLTTMLQPLEKDARRAGREVFRAKPRQLGEPLAAPVPSEAPAPTA